MSVETQRPTHEELFKPGFTVNTSGDHVVTNPETGETSWEGPQAQEKKKMADETTEEKKKKDEQKGGSGSEENEVGEGGDDETRSAKSKNGEHEESDSLLSMRGAIRRVIKYIFSGK